MQHCLKMFSVRRKVKDTMLNYQSYDVAVVNYPLFQRNTPKINFCEIVEAKSIEKDYKVPIYIHIPFCENLCKFCIYNRMRVKKDSEIVERYVNSLIREIKLYASFESIRKMKIGAVFIGGGTPTVLSFQQLYGLLKALSENFAMDDCEITVECNVQNGDIEKLKLLKTLGVNRISTGMQTFHEETRKRLNIQCDSKTVSRWMDKAAALHFDEIATDIIYGFPGLLEKQVLEDINLALKLPIQHLSLYKLTVFAYTELYRDMQKAQESLHSEENMEKLFSLAHAYLLEKGFQVYSTQEYGSDVKFWKYTYDGYGNNLSFGSSCFGYLNGYCYQNDSNVMEYIKKCEANCSGIERISSKITQNQLMERTMVIGFRKGAVSDAMFYNTFGCHIDAVFEDILAKHVKEGYIYRDNDKYRLTAKGYFYQGKVSADYMVSIFKGVSPLMKKMCIGEHSMP